MKDIKECPNCGGDIETGFGWFGGGYGPYIYCIGLEQDAECGWFYKEQEVVEGQ